MTKVRRFAVHVAIATSAAAFAIPETALAQPAPSSTPAAPPPAAMPPPQPWPAAPPNGAPGYYPPPGYGYGYGYPPYGYPYPPPYLLAPETIDYTEGDPVPPGYHVVSRIRKGLFVGGVSTFGGLYLISFVFGALLSDNQSAFEHTSFVPLYVPLAGPFITISTAQSQGVGTAVLLVDGIAQCAGLAMAIAGLAAPESKLIRNLGALHVTPIASPRLTGLGVSSSF